MIECFIGREKMIDRITSLPFCSEVTENDTFGR